MYLILYLSVYIQLCCGYESSIRSPLTADPLSGRKYVVRRMRSTIALVDHFRNPTPSLPAHESRAPRSLWKLIVNACLISSTRATRARRMVDKGYG